MPYNDRRRIFYEVFLLLFIKYNKTKNNMKHLSEHISEQLVFEAASPNTPLYKFLKQENFISLKNVKYGHWSSLMKLFDIDYIKKEIKNLDMSELTTYQEMGADEGYELENCFYLVKYIENTPIKNLSGYNDTDSGALELKNTNLFQKYIQDALKKKYKNVVTVDHVYLNESWREEGAWEFNIRLKNKNNDVFSAYEHDVKSSPIKFDRKDLKA